MHHKLLSHVKHEMSFSVIFFFLVIEASLPFAAGFLGQLCSKTCLSSNLALTLTLANDFRFTCSKSVLNIWFRHDSVCYSVLLIVVVCWDFFLFFVFFNKRKRKMDKCKSIPS